jgi:hypothetical protein
MVFVDPLDAAHPSDQKAASAAAASIMHTLGLVNGMTLGSESFRIFYNRITMEPAPVMLFSADTRVDSMYIQHQVKALMQAQQVVYPRAKINYMVTKVIDVGTVGSVETEYKDITA